MLLRLVVFVALLLASAYHAGRVFDLRDKDPCEGPILAMVERMRGEAVAKAWLTEPELSLSCYGPGYYWAVLAASTVLPWEHSLLPGRLVCLAATMASSLLVMRLVFTGSRSLDAALLGGLMFLLAPAVFRWGPYHRVDALALTFALAAYAFFRPNRRGVLAAAVCIVLGSLVRQTVALAAVPLLVHLLWKRQPAEALLFSLAVAGLGAAAWLAVDFGSGGYFLDAAIGSNMNKMHLASSFRGAFWFVRTPVGMAAFAALAFWYMSERRNELFSPVGLGLMLSFAFASLLIGKEGSAVNYFLEPSAFAAVVAATGGAATLLARFPRRAPVCLSAVAALLCVPSAYGLNEMRQAGLAAPAEYPRGREIVDAYPTGVEILADESLVDVALAAGRRPILNDPFVFRLRVDSGRLDPAVLIDRMKSGEVRLLLTHLPLAKHRTRANWPWPAVMLDAMEQYYELVSERDGVFEYRHKHPRTAVEPSGNDVPLRNPSAPRP